MLLKNVLRAQFNAGGKPNLVLAGPFNKRAFSLFTGRSTPIEQATSRTIVAAVDVYKSDFGTLKVVAARAGAQQTTARNKSTGKELRIARCYATEVS